MAAHRGGAAGHPENTLAAFARASRLGVHQVELDVRQSADGAIVVMHDATVDRTTDGSGRVGDLTLAQIRELDASGGGRGPEPVPTLQEVLQILPEDLWINVQIKEGERSGAAVAREIAEAGRLHQAFVAGGNRACREAKQACPGLLVCNLVRKRTRVEYLEHALREGADFIQFHHLRGPLEPELAARAHASGLRVNFLAAPDASVQSLCGELAAGADFLLVDDLARGLEALARVGVSRLRG